jgi:hypothetical protein
MLPVTVQFLVAMLALGAGMERVFGQTVCYCHPPMETSVAAFVCRGCGASLPLDDRAEVSCPFCQAVSEVPAEHRALWAARAAPDVLAAAERAWRRYARPRLGAAWHRTLGALSLAALVVGWVEPFVILHSHVDVGMGLPALLALTAWLPAVPLLVGGVYALYATRRTEGVPALKLGLSARRPEGPAGVLGCRQCGAPLSFRDGDLVARCLYCRCDNLVVLDAADAGAILREVRVLQRSLTDALKVHREQVRKTLAGLETALLVSLGADALPLLWSALRTFWGLDLGILLLLMPMMVSSLPICIVAGTVTFPSREFVSLGDLPDNLGAGLVWLVGILAIPVMPFVASALPGVARQYDDFREARPYVVAAERRYRTACARHEAEACYALQTEYAHFSRVSWYAEQSDRLFPEALPGYRAACSRGEIERCVTLARHALSGVGMKQDLGLGTQLLEEACSRGNEDSCVQVVRMRRGEQR